MPANILLLLLLAVLTASEANNLKHQGPTVNLAPIGSEFPVPMENLAPDGANFPVRLPPFSAKLFWIGSSPCHSVLERILLGVRWSWRVKGVFDSTKIGVWEVLVVSSFGAVGCPENKCRILNTINCKQATFHQLHNGFQYLWSLY